MSVTGVAASLNSIASRPRHSAIVRITHWIVVLSVIGHACKEGWSYIAEWTGVRLASVLDLVETRSEARHVLFEPFPNPRQTTGALRLLGGSIDMAGALHPQTLLPCGMNGEALPPDCGAPVRLRLGRHLGYKNVKYLSRIIVTDKIRFRGRGTWYGGI
jgi:DMSO/TMAO reductase YedYZ molybdopterin-dependent catalytic subunit